MARKHLFSLLPYFILSISFAFLFRSMFSFYVVHGESMEPTFEDHDYILVSKFENPKPNDIVVIDFYGHPIVKRIVAVAGETISIQDGQVYINNILLQEPYVSFSSNETLPPVRVPDGTVFVMGDNRINSMDSRFQEIGFIPLEQIVGVVQFKIPLISRN